MKISLLGNWGVSGVSNAFKMHSAAITSVVDDVEIIQLQEMAQPTYPHIYFHGLPRQMSLLETLDHQRLDAFWVCESTEVQPSFRKYAEKLHSIWTPSKFCYDIFNDIHPNVKLVPHYANLTGYRQPIERPSKLFLNMFDGGSRIQRKNPFQLIKAFKEAFGESSPHQLTIIVKNIAPVFKNELLQQANGYNIVITEKLFTPTELRKAYLDADFYVSTHRGEGFGLNILESLCCGTPTICNAFSGPADFVTAENSIIIPHTLADVNDDYFRGQWADMQTSDVVEALRIAANISPTSYKAKTASAFLANLSNNFCVTQNATFEALK